MRMFHLSDLPLKIPVFPLTGALVLPRASLPLNIFEPRYLQMVEDTLKTKDRLIGMIQTFDAPSDVDDPPLHRIGCAGRITSFTETDDGRYLISLKGVSRYRIIETHKGFTPYLQADVDWNDFERDLGPEEVDHSFDRTAFIEKLEAYFKAHNLQTDWNSLQNANEELLINSLSMMCPFSSEERQALLESPCLKTRRETIATLIEFSLCAHTEAQDKIQ